LVFQSGWWYLVGHCHLRHAPRTFRVDRIQKLTVLSQSFQAPENFDIHKYLDDEFKDQPVVRARLRFSAKAANIAIANKSIWESFEENPDGTIDVTMAAPDLPWLASMTMSFSNWVIVIEPPELRNMVRKWAQAIVDLYEIHSR
jgi:predicted DNA-binding transcriptional regulator YafY